MQVVEALFGSGEINLFRLFHQRADPINFLSLRNHRFQAVNNFTDAIQGYGDCFDFLTALWLVGQAGDVHIAEVREDQRAWDWCCCHHKHINVGAFGGQSQSLVDTKAVLLVYDCDAEVFEVDS